MSYSVPTSEEAISQIRWEVRCGGGCNCCSHQSCNLIRYANDIIISMQLSIPPPAFPLLIACYSNFFLYKVWIVSLVHQYAQEGLPSSPVCYIGSLKLTSAEMLGSSWWSVLSAGCSDPKQHLQPSAPRAMLISFLSLSPRLGINFTAFHAVWKTRRTTWPQSDRHPQKYSKGAGTSAKHISGSPYLMHKECCTGEERTLICLGYLLRPHTPPSQHPFPKHADIN